MGCYVVTGAATGIGAAVRSKLNEDGHDVISVDIKGDVDIHADLSSANGRIDAINNVLKRSNSGLDGLVPCAGVGPHVTPVSLITKLNYFGVRTIIEGLKNALQARCGSIVLVSSNTISTVSRSSYINALLDNDECTSVGLSSSVDGQAVYAESKFALIYWMRRHLTEFAQHGVRVNAVAPGFIRTPLTNAGLNDPKYAPLIKEFLQTIPLKREGEPGEVASAICFLLRREASYINGSILFVDGGYDAKSHDMRGD